MITAIAFFAYPIRNASQSRAFYEGLLGLVPTSNYRDAWIEYEVGDATFAISTMLEDELPGARGGIIAFEVDNFSETIDSLRAAGVRVIKEPFETPVCQMCCVADPDGNSVTLHSKKK